MQRVIDGCTTNTLSQAGLAGDLLMTEYGRVLHHRPLKLFADIDC